MEPSTNCPFDDERLTDYLVGELADPDRREVEQHLAECEICKMQLQQMREVAGLVSSVGSIEPSDGFAERIVTRASLRAVAREAVPAHARYDRARGRKRRPRFGMTIPEPRLALGRPMRFGRIAVYTAACAVLLLIYLARDLTQPPLPRDKRAITIVGAPSTHTESKNENDGLLFDPVDGWLHELPDDLVYDDSEPAIAPPDPFDWHLRPAERELPDMMDDLPIRPRERVEPRLSSGVFRARTSSSLKNHYVKYIGGDHQARVAVVEALVWLARHQDKDGKWNGVNFSQRCTSGKPCRDESVSDSKIDSVGLTASALLAFLGDGHTPNSGKYKATCARGFDWLMAQQQKSGCVGSRGRGPNHAMAATALAEVYGMTGNRLYRRAAQRAMGFVLASGGDKFRAGGSDLTMGFEMLALRTGEFAGLDVPAEASLEIRTAMATIPDIPEKAGLTELPPNTVTKPLLSGTYLIAKDDPNVSDASLQKIVAHLVNDRPEWKKGDTYYWFCGTLTMRQWLNRSFEKYHAGKKAEARDMVKAWKRWNAALMSTITGNQARNGHERGSWEPRGELCREGGRVLATALSTLTLESYYRHLPPE